MRDVPSRFYITAAPTGNAMIVDFQTRTIGRMLSNSHPGPYPTGLSITVPVQYIVLTWSVALTD